MSLGQKGTNPMLLVGIILILSFIINLWPIQLSHWWDETVYLQNSEVLFSGRDNYHEFAFRPPLLPLLFALGYFIYHHIFTASVIVAFLSSLGVLFIFLIGKELYNIKTGLVAALMLAFNPFIVQNSHYIMTDVPSLSLISISFYLLVIANKYKNNFYFLFSGFFFSLAILMRFTSLILLFVVPLYFWLQNIDFRKIIVFGIGFLVVMSPYLIWAQFTQESFIRPFTLAQAQVVDKNELLSFYFINFLKAYPHIILFGLISLILLSFFRLKNKNIRNFQRTDLIFVIWVLLFLTYLTINPHKELRYIIPIALPLILLSSSGISFLTSYNNKTIKYALSFIMAILFIMSSFTSFTRLASSPIDLSKSEELEISEFITNKYNNTTLIYTNHNYPVFAYYTNMKVIRLQNQDESFYSVYPSNMIDRGLLIIYRGLKHPTKEWVEGNNNFLVVMEFNNAVLYEYRP